MIIPKLPSIVDEIALQKSLALILADEARLAAVPILPEIKLLAESELLVDALWQLPRTAFKLTEDGWVVNQTDPNVGTVGNGILIEMPEMDYDSPGVRNGSPATWKVGIVGFCEPNIAFTHGVGTNFTSSQLCQIALDVFQMLNIYGLGTFKTEQQAIKAAHDWVSMKPGVSAHRLTITATVGRLSSQRSANVTAAFAGPVNGIDTVTLSCSDGAASVYYTTDGSEPVASNNCATLYSAPFTVASGLTVKFASKKTGLILSEILGAIAP